MIMKQINGKIYHAHRLEELTLKMSILHQCNLYQNINGSLHKTRTNNPKIDMEPQKTPNK